MNFGDSGAIEWCTAAEENDLRAIEHRKHMYLDCLEELVDNRDIFDAY